MQSSSSKDKQLNKRKICIISAILAILAGGLIYYFKGLELDPEALLRDYGYYVILIWTFLEGETIVIIAGMFAERFQLDPWLIALCAFCGSFASDQVMFSLGKYRGVAVLNYFPSVAKNIDRAAAMLKKYDVAMILGFRFVYGVRNVTPILLGISGVSHKKFFFLNFIGAGVWAICFSFGGYYVGQAFMGIMHKVGHGILYSLVGLGVLLLGLWIYRAKFARKKKGLSANPTEVVTPAVHEPGDISTPDVQAEKIKS